MHIKLVLMIAMAVAMVSGGTVPIKIRVERDAQGVRDSYDDQYDDGPSYDKFHDPQHFNKYFGSTNQPRTPVRDSYDPNRRKAVQEFYNFQAGKPGPNNRYAQHLQNGGFCNWCY